MPSATAIADLASRLSGTLITPADPDYDAAREVWNAMFDRRPALIARCKSRQDVAIALSFAQQHDLTIALRGGGHSVAGHGSCDNGLVIDLGPMDTIEIDAEQRIATLGPGLSWGPVDTACQQHGLAVTGGIVSATGVAGLTLGGGLGWLMRKHGLTADNLLSADLVTPAGEFIEASAEHEPELFWGLQRGGGNFGVVTRLRLALHPVGPIVLAGWILWPQEQAAELLRFHRELCADAPDDLTTIVILRSLPHLPKLPPFMRGQAVIGIAVCWCGNIEQGERALAPLRGFGTPLMDGISLKPYAVHQKMFDAGNPPGRHHYWKSAYLKALEDGTIDALQEAARSMTSPMSVMAIYQLGGAAQYGDARFCLNLAAMWPAPDAGADADADADASKHHDAPHVAWARHGWESVQPWASAATYVNFLGTEGEQRTRSAYLDSHQRLVALKDRFDPDNCLHLNQNIRPSTMPA